MPVHFVVAGSRAPFSWTLDRNIDVHTTMKIGKFVQQHISAIFNYCDNVAHEEIARLLDPEYSKDIFGIHFPFCAQVENITDKDSVRYWVRIYRVRGKQVRVTSQWFDYNFSKFESYLGSKHIALSSQPRTQTGNEDVSTKQDNPTHMLTNKNIRYRGNAIGNAQNLFIRNILSNLGKESFTEKDWLSTKEYFSNKCAYCEADTYLHMEHAIPINRDTLGEHRLGNLVPSCKRCNSNKHHRDYREFLGDNAVAIKRIEDYMGSRGYVPLKSNEQVAKLLNVAHMEVSALADKYISSINGLLQQAAIAS